MPPAAKIRPEVRGAAVKVVLDQEREQDLDRPHEEQVGDGGAREGRPQPDVPADVREPGPDVAGHGDLFRARATGTTRHRQDRCSRHREGRRIERERGAHSHGIDQQSADRRPGKAQHRRAHELVERVRLGELLLGQHLRRDRVERRAEERGRGAVAGDERDHVPQLERAGQRQQSEHPHEQSAGRGRPPASPCGDRSGRSRPRRSGGRRSWAPSSRCRRATAPSGRSRARTPARRSPRGRRRRRAARRTCRSTASRKSRCRNGASNRTRLTPPGRSSPS